MASGKLWKRHSHVAVPPVTPRPQSPLHSRHRPWTFSVTPWRGDNKTSKELALCGKRGRRKRNHASLRFRVSCFRFSVSMSSCCIGRLRACFSLVLPGNISPSKGTGRVWVPVTQVRNHSFHCSCLGAAALGTTPTRTGKPCPQPDALPLDVYPWTATLTSTRDCLLRDAQ